MKNLLLVTVAGGIGSAARYLVSMGMLRLVGPGFPYGTLTVNVVGSFLIALLIQVSLASEQISPVMRLTLTTGFLGGFTTYSAFNFESLELMSRGEWRLALTNLLVTVVTCLVAGALGWRAARLWVGM